MTDSNIINKIRKLLTLADAERGGTEAERDLAMKRATEMMAKYNVEQAQLTEQSAEGNILEEFVEVTGAMNQWQADLYHAVGAPNFCTTLYWKLAKHRKRVSIIGRADNVTFTRILCEHLIPWLEEEERSASRREKRYAEEGGYFFNPRAFKRSFMESAMYRIRTRLVEVRTSSGIGTEIVVSESAANEEFMMQKYPDTRKATKRGSGQAAGHAAGREAGSRADLSPGHKLGA